MQACTVDLVLRLQALTDLLGPKLTSKSGDVDTSIALAGKQVIGLYFSAHWCPPCRGFTPKLAEKYAELIGAGKSLEIIFVSSDRDEPAFAEYYGEQPWLALPFAARDTKAALSKKYKVSGIPSLVLLDAEGKTITKEGREAVMQQEFPFTPPTFWDCFGTEFMTHDGDSVEVDDLKGDGKVIVLYFSAHWCPPCRGFTPELVKTVGKLKEAGKPFEIVFVSSDRDMKSFQEYYGTMTGFLAIPQGDKRKEKLSSYFGVEGIPSLVTVDAATGKTINANARGACGGDPDGKEFPWAPKPVTDFAEGADGINDTLSLCLMMDGCSADVQVAAIECVTPIAEAAKAKEEEICFFSATGATGPVPQIRKLTGLGDATQTPKLLLLDIPDSGGYYVSDATEVTAATVNDFLAGYKAGKLERKQLS